ncbi:MAG: histidine kinase [Pelomonas sp.]|nr:histidine kinase [Roseateles sp.]
MKPWMSMLLRQLGIVLGVAIPLAALVAFTFHQSYASTLYYSLCIAVCCSALVQGLHELLVRLRGRRGERWLGWPLTFGLIVVGVLLGNPIGSAIANWFAGVPNTTLLPGYANFETVAFLLAISITPGVAIAYFFNSRERLAAAQAQAAEHRLRLLEAQLEPHMLFNTLANLRALIESDPARAQAMLDHLIAFLRALLQGSRLGGHGLAAEFARLQDYLALMQVRMGPRLRSRFELPAELAEVEIPPLLLQPIVENAIQHGLEPALDGGEIVIAARREGESVLVEVRDSGVGLGGAVSPTAAAAAAHTGFGLAQVRERLATRFGATADASFEIRSPAEGGTLAIVRLPCRAP